MKRFAIFLLFLIFSIFNLNSQENSIQEENLTQNKNSQNLVQTQNQSQNESKTQTSQNQNQNETINQEIQISQIENETQTEPLQENLDSQENLNSQETFYNKDKLKSQETKKIQELFAQIHIYELTGFSDYPEIQKYTGISKIPSIILSLPFWQNDCSVLTLFDYYFKDYAGLLDSYLPYNSVLEDCLWLLNLNSIQDLKTFEENEINENFAVNRPEILDEIQNELNSLLENENLTENLKNDDNSELNELIQTNKNVNILDESNIVENRLTNSLNELSMYSYGAEIFGIQKQNQNYVKVNSLKNKTKRQFYDEKMRLIKIENWLIETPLKNSKIEKTQIFEYADSNVPVLCKILEENSTTLINYDQKGRIIESKNYKLLKNNQDSIEKTQNQEDSQNQNENKKFVLNSRTLFKYSENDNLLEKNYFLYEYKDEFSSTIIKRSNFKDVYEYKIESFPDYFYYENDVLRLKTIYSNENSYVTTSYFDGNFVVESYYEQDFHKKDLYYLNGVLKREKTYEK